MRNLTVSFLAAAMGFSLLLTGCSSAQNNTFTAQEAIAKYKSKYVSDFPDKPGVWETVSRRIGGPCCRTFDLQVETDINNTGDNTYILTLNERWLNLEYYKESHPTVNQYFHHQSKVKVTPTSITLLGESGDPEPDNAG